MKAKYLDFFRGRKDRLSFVGGQPTHLPLQKPWLSKHDHLIGFFMQLWIKDLYPLSDIIALQFYQPIEDGNDPSPFVIPIREGYPYNHGLDVVQMDEYGEWGIEFVSKEEPDLVPETNDTNELTFYQSKLGGISPWEFLLPEGTKFVGQIAEGPISLNFGGTSCILYTKDDHSVLSMQL